MLSFSCHYCAQLWQYLSTPQVYKFHYMQIYFPYKWALRKICIFYLILRLRSHSQKCDRGASAVPVNLSKYFVTLNHESLMNLLRKNIHDKRGIAGETGFEGWSHGNGLPAKAKEGVP